MLGLVLIAILGLLSKNNVIAEPDCALDTETLWPDYNDNTKFFMCVTEQKSMLLSCPKGKWFTYVHQSCVEPEEWIRPPVHQKPSTKAIAKPTTKATPKLTTAAKNEIKVSAVEKPKIQEKPSIIERPLPTNNVNKVNKTPKRPPVTRPKPSSPPATHPTPPVAVKKPAATDKNTKKAPVPVKTQKKVPVAPKKKDKS